MSHALFYLIRHATTAKVGRGLTGWTPGVPLDENGRAQAEALPNMLSSVPVTAICSSPLERALQTAEPLARARGLEIQTNPAFGEIRFGRWEGKEFPEIETDAKWNLFNRFRSATPAPDGEMMLETQVRFVKGLLETAREREGGRIAVFSHADAIKSAVAHFLGIPLDLHLRLEISPASVTILELYDETAIVRGLNITRTLVTG